MYSLESRYSILINELDLLEQEFYVDNIKPYIYLKYSNDFEVLEYG
jgi:hypothetical protein